MSNAKHTPDRAEAAGLTVDRHCYPWVAYRGPRFKPDELHDCLTDLETEMLEALKAVQGFLNDDSYENADRVADLIDRAIAKAEGGAK